MASIIKRGKKYRALIRKKGISRCRTFETKTAAKTWATRIEAEIDHASTGSRLPVRGWTIGTLIDRYIADVKPHKKWGPSKDSALEIIKRHVGDVPAAAFSVDMVLHYVQDRRRQEAGDSTINSDLSYLSSAVKYARNSLRLDIAPEAIKEARGALSDSGMMTTSRERDRRPSEHELQLLREYFDQHCTVPMNDIIEFAIHSGMRRGEICSIRWGDLDESKKTMIIRNRKHPTKKYSNDQEVPLLNGSFALVQKQSRVDERIFPFAAQSVSAAFIRGCKATGIKDLRFHDLRHHALSILFEQGYKIQEVAIVSGHSSWDMLKRYTHIKPESLHREVRL